VTLQAYSVDKGSEVQAMRGKHVDQRVGLAARRQAILVGALALAGVLNVSGCSNRTAITATAAPAQASWPQRLNCPKLRLAPPHWHLRPPGDWVPPS
jgi:hypothetical protein